MLKLIYDSQIRKVIKYNMQSSRPIILNLFFIEAIYKILFYYASKKSKYCNLVVYLGEEGVKVILKK